MSSTLLYQLALFVHILGAFGLIAGMTLESVGVRGLRQAESGDAARAALRAMQFVPFFGGISGGLILLSGLYMMATSGGPRGWALFGLVGMVLNALSGAIVTRARMARVAPVASRASGLLSADVRRTLRDQALLTAITTRIGLVLGILFLMTVKPSTLTSLVVMLAAALLGLVAPQVFARRDRYELRSENG